MNIIYFFNEYYNIIIIASVFFTMLLMGTLFFFLFRYIGNKNMIYRIEFKKENNIETESLDYYY